MTPSLQLDKITLAQYRNYTVNTFLFPNQITCITGKNGTGKTNLLDAVYYLCYTKSYFTSQQQGIAQHTTDGFRLEGFFEKAKIHSKVACKWQAGKKEIFLNDAVVEKATDHIGKYSAVMIAPDDIEVINGGGELRRKWIDSILGQSDLIYLEHLLLYQKVLLQRNAWLKLQVPGRQIDRGEIEFYDMQLVKAGTEIFKQRSAFLQIFLPVVNELYATLSSSAEIIDIQHSSDLYQKDFSRLIADGFDQDLRLQRTNRGIHRDDFQFQLDGQSLKQFGSQGQKKSFLFALKLAQFRYITDHLKHKPILLLDDVFEKLDQSRLTALLKMITHESFGQVIITDTHKERVQTAFGAGADLHFIEL